MFLALQLRRLTRAGLNSTALKGNTVAQEATLSQDASRRRNTASVLGVRLYRSAAHQHHRRSRWVCRLRWWQKMEQFRKTEQRHLNASITRCRKAHFHRHDVRVSHSGEKKSIEGKHTYCTVHTNTHRHTKTNTHTDTNTHTHDGTQAKQNLDYTMRVKTTNRTWCPTM